MRKWRWKSHCAMSFGNTEVKNNCRKLRTSATPYRASSLFESQLYSYK
jgi:hypothetical protein